MISQPSSVARDRRRFGRRWRYQPVLTDPRDLLAMVGLGALLAIELI
jgi:hypothetical protein